MKTFEEAVASMLMLSSPVGKAEEEFSKVTARFRKYIELLDEIQVSSETSDFIDAVMALPMAERRKQVILFSHGVIVGVEMEKMDFV